MAVPVWDDVLVKSLREGKREVCVWMWWWWLDEGRQCRDAVSRCAFLPSTHPAPLLSDTHAFSLSYHCAFSITAAINASGRSATMHIHHLDIAISSRPNTQTYIPLCLLRHRRHQHIGSLCDIGVRHGDGDPLLRGGLPVEACCVVWDERWEGKVGSGK